MDAMAAKLVPLRTWLIDPNAAWQTVLPRLEVRTAFKRYALAATACAAMVSSYFFVNAVNPNAFSFLFIAFMVLAGFGVGAFLLLLTGAIVHSASRWAGGKPDGKGTAIIFFVFAPVSALAFLIVVVPTLVPSGGVTASLVGTGVLICLAAITSAGLLVTYAGLKASYQTSGSKFFTGFCISLASGVIIAIVAILIVLLPYLLCCQDFGYRSITDADSVMKVELKSVVSAGFGTSTPKQIELKKDEYIDIKSVVGDASIVENDVQFKCGLQSPELCSGSDAPLDIDATLGTGSILVNQNAKAYVVVCGDEQRPQNPKYCIVIGRQGSDARQTCTDTCLR